MSKLSKTARAAVRAGENQKKGEVVQITPDQAIHQIRMNLAAVPVLFSPSNLIQLLLNEYDKEVKENKALRVMVKEASQKAGHKEHHTAEPCMDTQEAYARQETVPDATGFSGEDHEHGGEG